MKKGKSAKRTNVGRVVKALLGLVMMAVLFFVRPPAMNVEPNEESDDEEAGGSKTKRLSSTSSSGSANSAKSTIPKSVAGLEFLQQGGDNWKIWDASSTEPLYADRGFGCGWMHYTVTSPKYNTAEMCAHPGPDIVSGWIRSQGSWACCRPMPKRYMSALERPGLAPGDPNRPKMLPVHIEIGANIGACVVHMLLSDPDLHVVAFEPYPPNLFRLTTTLLHNPDFHRRVTVFPIGLGNHSETVPMTTEQKANFGSARIDGSADASSTSNPNGTETGRAMGPVDMVSVEPLDKILSLQESNSLIPLMKMDVQGYECRVIEGMTTLVRQVDQVYTELDDEILKFHGCSSVGLMERLTEHVQKPIWAPVVGTLHKLPVTNLPSGVNIVAIKHPKDHDVESLYTR